MTPARPEFHRASESSRADEKAPIGADCPKSSSVTAYDAEWIRSSPIGGQLVEHRGLEDPAGAEADHVDVVGARDLTDGVDGLEDPLGVGVDVPVATARHRGLRQQSRNVWSPRRHGVLDEAPARPQVEEVVAPDRRRHHEDRAFVHLVGRRGVLEQLGVLVLVDDLTGRHAPGPRRP